MSRENRYRSRDITYILLPFPLWTLTFIMMRRYFWILMPTSTTILGLITIFLYREKVYWGRYPKSILSGFIVSIILYIIFLLGDIATRILNMKTYIDRIYQLIHTSPNKEMLILSLIWIGFMEELYWRGGLQGLLNEYNQKISWLASSIPYTLVHIVTLNPILVIAAFIVGITMGITAYRYGIISSSTAHILWLLLIIVKAPLR